MVTNEWLPTSAKSTSRCGAAQADERDLAADERDELADQREAAQDDRQR
jgi:hypothetical protein